MSTVCKTTKELGEAIKNNEESIEIEGDLKKQVFRIKATGKVAWGVCASVLGVAIVFYLVTSKKDATGGAALFVSGMVTTTAAATILGSAAVPAALIGIAAEGIGALNTLRDKYEIVEENEEHIKLQRK